jgi:hypothetical protein
MMGNPVYLMSTKVSKLAWPVSRGCLLLHGTWPYLCLVGDLCCPTLNLVFWMVITLNTFVNFANDIFFLGKVINLKSFFTTAIRIEVFFFLMSFKTYHYVIDMIGFFFRVGNKGTHFESCRLFTDWLIIYGFTSCSRIFHLYGDVTIDGERLQILA